MREPSPEDRRDAYRTVRQNGPALFLGLLFWNSPLVAWTLTTRGHDAWLLGIWLLFFCTASGIIWLTCRQEECVRGDPECTVKTPLRMWAMFLGQTMIFAGTWILRYSLLKPLLIVALGS